MYVFSEASPCAATVFGVGCGRGGAGGSSSVDGGAGVAGDGDSFAGWDNRLGDRNGDGKHDPLGLALKGAHCRGTKREGDGETDGTGCEAVRMFGSGCEAGRGMWEEAHPAA